MESREQEEQIERSDREWEDKETEMAKQRDRETQSG